VARERTKRGNKCIYSRAEVHGTHSREYIEHDGGKRETEVQGDEDEGECGEEEGGGRREEGGGRREEGGGGRGRGRGKARDRVNEHRPKAEECHPIYCITGRLSIHWKLSAFVARRYLDDICVREREERASVFPSLRQPISSAASEVQLRFVQEHRPRLLSRID